MTADRTLTGPRRPERTEHIRGTRARSARGGGARRFGRGALVVYGLGLAVLGVALNRGGTDSAWRALGLVAVLLAAACVVLATRTLAPPAPLRRGAVTSADSNAEPGPALMPSDVSSRVGTFDRFAGLAANLASRAPFFIACIALVVAWLIEGAVKVASGGGLNSFQDSAYQLQINTTTTIVTFLLVALLQNSATRSDQATQHKLNAIADGLADLMGHLSRTQNDKDLRQDLLELREAVGLENREDTSKS
jgi:hypothetical protein